MLDFTNYFAVDASDWTVSIYEIKQLSNCISIFQVDEYLIIKLMQKMRNECKSVIKCLFNVL